MNAITLRVLDGADRGRVFQGLTPPVTIGREEGNIIQLNDDRVSRYHVKIQSDNDQLVLTDLESTNGTRVNGEDIHLRILRFGDLISLGRSVLIFGSRDEIATRLATIRGQNDNGSRKVDRSGSDVELASHASSLDFELNLDNDGELQAKLHALEPPNLPTRLSPGQAAQLSELLEYVQIRLRKLIHTVSTDDRNSANVELTQANWQNLLDLQSQLSTYLRQIGNPDQPE